MGYILQYLWIEWVFLKSSCEHQLDFSKVCSSTNHLFCFWHWWVLAVCFLHWAGLLCTPHSWEAEGGSGDRDCCACIWVLVCGYGMCPAQPPPPFPTIPLWPHCDPVATPGELAISRCIPNQDRQHLCTATSGLGKHLGGSSSPVLTIRPSSFLLSCAPCPPLFTAFPKVKSREVGGLGEKRPPCFILPELQGSTIQGTLHNTYNTERPKRWFVRTSMENFPLAVSPLTFTWFLFLHFFPVLMV